MKFIMFAKILLLCLVKFTISARILILLPAPSPSHHIFFRPIIRELSLRGHDVVSITPNPINDPKLTNLTEIDIHKETYGVINGTQWLEEAQKETLSEVSRIRKYCPLLIETGDRVLSAPKVKALLRNPDEHFDLLISEMLMMNAHYLGFKEHFNCPAIGLASMDTTLNGLDAIGNPPHPNYYASFFTIGGASLSFWERLESFWHNIDFRMYYFFHFVPMANQLLNKHFNIKTKDVWELEKSVDLVLANTNPVFHIPKPHVPSYIEIGGLNGRVQKPLPQDLQQFLDNSKHGVVYFSLGSNIRSSNLPIKTRQSILKAFEQLPYNILLKWEDETLQNKPNNVYIKDWLPQQEVLDHPNMKAFVTHGGLKSVEEAIQSKVPMIGIPFGGDQPFNVRRMADLEIGRQLLFEELSTELLMESIIDVANNPKYKKNVSKLSGILWDQITKPLDRAIWWIEYTIRHKGAQHLRCPAADLSWYKFLLLDIIGFILGVSILSLSVLIYLLKIILKYVFSGKSSSSYKRNVIKNRKIKKH